MDPQPQSSLPIPPQPIQPPPQSHHSPLFIVLFIIASAVAGYFGYQYYQLKQIQPPPISQISPISPTPTQVATSNWKTYTNKDFSFQYPQDWKVESKKIFSTEDNIEMWAYESDDSLYNECMKLTSSQTVEAVTVKHFSGVTNSGMCDPANVSKREKWIVKTNSDGFAPGLQYSYGSTNASAEKIFNQILSTFKFTK